MESFFNPIGTICREEKGTDEAGNVIVGEVAVFNTARDAKGYADLRNAGQDAKAARKIIDNRAKAREYRKARDEAMRSVGMVKTRYGWE